MHHGDYSVAYLKIAKVVNLKVLITRKNYKYCDGC